MRNLLINLTFIFALLICNSTNIFAQINGQTPDGASGISINGLVSVSVTISDNGGVFRGTGIVQPITGREAEIMHGVGNLTVNVSITDGRGTLYSDNSQYTEVWESLIPSSETSQWGSGTFQLIVTVGDVSVVSEEFTLD